MAASEPRPEGNAVTPDRTRRIYGLFLRRERNIFAAAWNKRAPAVVIPHGARALGRPPGSLTTGPPPSRREPRDVRAGEAMPKYGGAAD